MKSKLNRSSQIKIHATPLTEESTSGTFFKACLVLVSIAKSVGLSQDTLKSLRSVIYLFFSRTSEISAILNSGRARWLESAISTEHVLMMFLVI